MISVLCCNNKHDTSSRNDMVPSGLWQWSNIVHNLQFKMGTSGMDFDERPHRSRRISSQGDDVMCPVWSMRLPQFCCHWSDFFRCVKGRSTDSQCFSMAGPPSKLTLPVGIFTPSNNGFLGPSESTLQLTSRSFRPFLQSLQTWPADIQTMLLGL